MTDDRCQRNLQHVQHCLALLTHGVTPAQQLAAAALLQVPFISTPRGEALYPDRAKCSQSAPNKGHQAPHICLRPSNISSPHTFISIDEPLSRAA